MRAEAVALTCVLAFGRRRQENQELKVSKLEANLGYMKPTLKETTEGKRGDDSVGKVGL